MNINPKQAEHAAVASFDSQYLHREDSELIAAPQLGQLRVWASMLCVAQAGSRRDIFSLTFQPSTVNGKTLDRSVLNCLLRLGSLCASLREILWSAPKVRNATAWGNAPG
jgi:hypothetical protein